MSVSDMVSPSPACDPPLERAKGEARLSLDASDGTTRLTDLYQQGAARLRFPARQEQGYEAVLLNTAGGLTGGDQFVFSVALDNGAKAIITSQACEKIYRSAAGSAGIENYIQVGAGCHCDWLPQETILFDGARLRRNLSATLDASASLLMVEGLIFGRRASGETVSRLRLDDRITIRRGGSIVYADALQLDSDRAAPFAGKARLDDAAAVATLLYVAPDSEARLDEARALVAACSCEAGASAWNGILVIRLIAASAELLRADLVTLLHAWRGSSLPRAWSI